MDNENNQNIPSQIIQPTAMQASVVAPVVEPGIDPLATMPVQPLSPLNKRTWPSARLIGIVIIAFVALGFIVFLLTRSSAEADNNTLNANPSINGKNGWNFADAPVIAAYDSSVSRGKKSGSIRFDSGSKVTDQVIAVQPGAELKISAWTKQDSWAIGTISMEVVSMEYQRNYSKTHIIVKKGDWRKTTTSFTVPNGVTSLRLVFNRAAPQVSEEPLWVDDVRVTKE